jgi:YHS domain-containing protein
MMQERVDYKPREKNCIMKNLLLSISTLFLLSVPASLFSQTAKRIQQFNVNKSSLAIDGYDPVAYFTQNKAIEGKKDIAVIYEGITYRFATIQNKQAFSADPARYEPQYGGWCAYAMGASGEKVEVDPETFKIINGKLYLFYNSFFNNTLKSWNKNESSLKAKADINWKTFY